MHGTGIILRSIFHFQSKIRTNGSIRHDHESRGQGGAAQAIHPQDISLSFFPGAKIGVLGLNGAGKSTLLKIMAGVDKDIDGEITWQNDLKIGYLPQEPQLDPEATVRQAVEEGMGEVMQAQAKLDAVYAAYAEPDADFDALAAEQARLEAIIAAAGTDASTQMEIAADALRLPPWEAKIGHLSGGESAVWLCVVSCCRVRICCC